MMDDGRLDQGELVLANAEIVLPGEVRRGALKVVGGTIADIAEGGAVPPGATDCEGALLIPGLVELHTDNLERHISPRPKVDWPHDAALIAHDAELAGCAITTVFDAMRLGVIEGSDAEDKQYARALATELLTLRAAGALRISHFLHLRAEICSVSMTEELLAFGPEDRVGLISIMDHTPGQRQFRNTEKLKVWTMGRSGMSLEEFEAHVLEMQALRARVGDGHEAAAVAGAAALGAVLASHDDTTAAHVARSAQHGVQVAEFPTTEEAAAACRAHGIPVMMGAPNLIRGGSHSGNVSAADLARGDLLDIVSSDYVPAALLPSALKLGEIWGDLARGIRTVTDAPAAAVGLTDRGRIEIGGRADLARIRLSDHGPIISGVWSQGRRVA